MILFQELARRVEDLVFDFDEDVILDRYCAAKMMHTIMSTIMLVLHLSWVVFECVFLVFVE